MDGIEAAQAAQAVDAAPQAAPAVEAAQAAQSFVYPTPETVLPTAANPLAQAAQGNQAQGNPAQAQAQAQTQSQAQGWQPQAQQGNQPQASPDNPAQAQGNQTQAQDPLDIPLEKADAASWNLNGVEMQKECLDAFAGKAVELKLTQRQAEQLIQYEAELFESQRAAKLEASIQTLNKEWGASASDHQQSVKNLVRRIDEKLGGSRFSQALDSSGASLDADIMAGLLCACQMCQEDFSGVGSAAAQVKPETALDGIKAVFAKAQGR